MNNLWLFLLGCFAYASFAKATPQLIAFGSLHGFIEPCGCDPKTDLGGLKRLAYSISSFKGKYPDGMVFGLGSYYSATKTHDDAEKNSFIFDALNKFPFTATLVTDLDMQRVSGRLPQSVLSNSLKAQPGIASVITTEQAHIFGFTEGSISEHLAPFSKDLLKQWERLATPPKMNILLFHGQDRVLKEIIATQFFSLIISSSTLSATTKPDGSQKDKEGLLLRHTQAALSVYEVPFAGQGILKLPPNDHKALDLFAPKNTPLFASPFLWLDYEYDHPSFLDQLTKERATKQEQDFKIKAAQKLAIQKAHPDKDSYSGAAACATCHSSAYKVWLDSAHAKAFATLENKGKQFDPECVSCHVLGFKEPLGFVSKSDSPQLANVQCETCHGPRAMHIQGQPGKKEMNKDQAKAICVSCHHVPHSTEFEFSRYWQKISHGF